MHNLLAVPCNGIHFWCHDFDKNQTKYLLKWSNAFHWLCDIDAFQKYFSRGQEKIKSTLVIWCSSLTQWASPRHKKRRISLFRASSSHSARSSIKERIHGERFSRIVFFCHFNSDIFCPHFFAGMSCFMFVGSHVVNWCNFFLLFFLCERDIFCWSYIGRGRGKALKSASYAFLFI